MRHHAAEQAAQGQLTIAIEPQGPAMISVSADGPGTQDRLHRPGNRKGLIVEPAQRAQLAEQLVKAEAGAGVDPDLAMGIVHQRKGQIPHQRHGVELGQLRGELAGAHARCGGQLQRHAGHHAGTQAAINEAQAGLFAIVPSAHGGVPCLWRPFCGPS